MAPSFRQALPGRARSYSAARVLASRMGVLRAVAASIALFALPAAAASHTAGATVVVLNGLAGDVESERSYDEQMRALLERLARPGSRPKTLVVLTDAPARIALIAPGTTVMQFQRV